MATCSICSQRKGKRYCTAIGEDICPQCCARDREVTVNCPFECAYLRESRLHDRRPLDPAHMPHPEVSIDEALIKRADIVLVLLSAMLLRALKPVPNATDRQARQAVDSLIAVFTASDDGSAPVPAPEDPVTAGILERFRAGLDSFLTTLDNREQESIFGDRVILGVLVFMARVAYGYDNQRPNGRAYVHYLRATFPESEPAAEPEPEPAQ